MATASLYLYRDRNEGLSGPFINLITVLILLMRPIHWSRPYWSILVQASDQLVSLCIQSFSSMLLYFKWLPESQKRSQSQQSNMKKYARYRQKTSFRGHRFSCFSWITSCFGDLEGRHPQNTVSQQNRVPAFSAKTKRNENVKVFVWKGCKVFSNRCEFSGLLKTCWMNCGKCFSELVCF